MGIIDPELITEKITTFNKTFLIDLRKNQGGYYLKMSEWSNDKKSSIFLPEEGVDRLIDILHKFKSKISEDSKAKGSETSEI